MHKADPPIGRRLVGYKQLKDIGITFSREHLWRLEAANRFPRRIYLSPQKVVWDLDEVLSHVARLAAERANRVYRNHD